MMTLPTVSGPSTVFIIDDDEAVRESLAYLVESMGHLVEGFCSAVEFLEKADMSRQGCILSDVRMPQMSGMELLDRLSTDSVLLPMIIITGHGDIPMSVRAMRQGAIDFLEKPYRGDELESAILRAIETNITLRQKAARRADIDASLAKLSAGELEVARRISRGSPNKAIARELDISLRTVEYRKSKLMKKLNLASNADLISLIRSAESLRDQASAKSHS